MIAFSSPGLHLPFTTTYFRNMLSSLFYICRQRSKFFKEFAQGLTASEEPNKHKLRFSQTPFSTLSLN